MRLVGTYFDLTDRFVPNPAAKARPVIADGKEPRDGGVQRGGVQGGGAQGGGKGAKVLISVAKRLVPSAVRRNTVKRIVREAWRNANRKASQSSQQGAENRSARASVQDSSAVQPGAGADRVCLVRLKRYPGKDLKALNRKAEALKRKAGKTRMAKAPLAASSSRPTAPGKPPAAVTGLADIKRTLRADADQLFAAFLAGRARHRSAALKTV